MNANPNLNGYNQTDIEALLKSGSIVPNIDDYSNLIIQNIGNQLFSSSISIELNNLVYIPTKVETKIDPIFYQI
jgi:hypothetical protein